MSMTQMNAQWDAEDKLVSQMAATIYTTYVSRGVVEAGQEASWMHRSIREAVRDADAEHDARPVE